MIKTLQRLLSALYPKKVSLDILTVKDVEKRYPLTKKGQPAMSAIAQAQRINRAKGDYHQAGLCEFHIGLIYWHWKDYGEAAQQFAAARQQWKFINQTAAVCLTYYAEGKAREHGLMYEEGMRQYGRGQQLLSRLRLLKTNDAHAFINKIEPLLLTAQKKLRDKMWPAEEPPADTDQTPPPVNNLNNASFSDTPIPDHQNNNNQHEWYRVIKHKNGSLTDSIQDWVLVDKQPQNRGCDTGTIVLIEKSERLRDSIMLLPRNSQEENTASICLARVETGTEISPEPTRISLTSVKEWRGIFTRDSGNITFMEGKTEIVANCVDIIGVVIGVWQQKLTPKK